MDVARGFAWPVFRHVSFSPEGTWERWRAFNDAERPRTRRGRPLRRAWLALWLALPVMVAFVVVVAVVAFAVETDYGPLVLVVVGALVLARWLRGAR